MTAVVHVVLVQWGRPPGEAAAEAERLVDRHLGRVEGVTDVARGASISTEGLESGLDWGLVVRFASEQALSDYLPDPDHRVVAEHLRAHAERIVVFDLRHP